VEYLFVKPSGLRINIVEEENKIHVKVRNIDSDMLLFLTDGSNDRLSLLSTNSY
jgi:hypothetical protein